MTTLLTDLTFHHIGLACRKLHPEMKAHEQLGYKIEGQSFTDPIQRVNGIFMTHGSMRIELLEPATSDSPLTDILKRGQKMYHQCFECEDLQVAIDKLMSEGAHLIAPPAPAVAFEGRRIAFLVLRTMMIVELVESN